MQKNLKPSKAQRNAIKSARRQSHSLKVSESFKSERSVKRSARFSK